MAEATDVIDAAPAAPQIKLVRERSRIESLKIDKPTIAERIRTFYDNDMQDRKDEINARLQRYAKFRMWTEGKNWPWPDATDSAIPDMMTASMRLQDTLHNAAMSQRPPVMAKATKKADAGKEEVVSDLIDYQFFEEQPGEEIIGQLADDFVNEGLYTAYIPWVKETRAVKMIKVFGPIPPDMLPSDYFLQLLLGTYPQAVIEPSGDGWDFRIKDGEKRNKASFFSRDSGEIEMELEHDALVYDGPRVIRKDIQDVLHPARCENLQIPGPSNPLGASHVILRDYPTVDELTRLSMPDRDGNRYYDMMTEDDKEQLGIAVMSTDHQEREEQKDTMQGHSEQRTEKPKGAESHGQLTRLMCFDCYDINGDGVDEDVIWWMILETKTLLRAKYLTQMFPATKPRRPFAEAGLFPVPGRRYAIGLLEMMEGLHDLSKQFFDQGGDAGTLANSPFGFYRSASNMRPEVIRMTPGELYPLSDPRNDINFPTMGDRSQSFTFNMLTTLDSMKERLTTIGELQLGRVPQGKASALRTVSGMQTVLAQGDARPERVLRRFFLGLTQIWNLIHVLNQAFLPKGKQYMIAGTTQPGKDPYKQLDGPTDVAGDYRFTFSANALNTSKDALQMALQQLMGAYVSELNLQLGIIDPSGIYRLQRDWGRALGPDPDKYLKPPAPGADQPPILAEEAMDMLIAGEMPAAPPMEGAEAHLQKMTELVEQYIEQVGGATATPQEQQMAMQVTSNANAYLKMLGQRLMQERQQAQLMAAVQSFQAGAQPGGKPGPAAGPQAPERQAMLEPNELANESLPGAGGGANPVPA